LNLWSFGLYELTVKGWKISEAKARLSEVVAHCVEEPQVLYNRKRPVAVLVDMEEYEAFESYKRSLRSPGMGELLDELEAINAEEADLDPPVRRDRDVPSME
jgi:prevent-host-death family protein